MTTVNYITYKVDVYEKKKQFGVQINRYVGYVISLIRSDSDDIESVRDEKTTANRTL